MVKILLHGYRGRMGQVLAQIITETEGMEVAGGVDSKAESNQDFPTFDSIDKCNVKADVVIDFSYHEAVTPLVTYCTRNNLPLVIATTGLSKETLEIIDEATNVIPIFRSANMSVGINLLAKAIGAVMPALEQDFHVEIIEKHHAMKKDSPSGTALLLADAVNKAAEKPKEYVYGRHGKEDVCTKDLMGIHAVRGGTIVGEHTVLFAGPEEIIELKHTALSREVFARGAVRAAVYLTTKGPGIYNMEDLLSE